jgi:hypothetical protein
MAQTDPLPEDLIATADAEPSPVMEEAVLAEIGGTRTVQV